jgi:uncharacterized protein Smg (DUF494 family)
MYERIVEIIIHVMSELRRKNEFSEGDIIGLEKLGYSEKEISAAFSWIVDKVEFAETMFPVNENTKAESFRVLNQNERDLFTPEAWGEMIQLNSLGILTNESIENLIERAVFIGAGSIDSNHLKWFVAHSIFNIHTQELPGSRIMLTGSDTIH